MVPTKSKDGTMKLNVLELVEIKNALVTQRHCIIAMQEANGYNFMKEEYQWTGSALRKLNKFLETVEDTTYELS